MAISSKISFVVIIIAVFYYLFRNRLFRPLPLHTDGKVEPAFSNVSAVFRKLFEDGIETEGAAFAVYWKGRKVVDLWGGYAEKEIEKPWHQNTIAVVQSVTKGVGAICLALLYDRGRFSYDDPVSRYWPEFGLYGKEKISIKQLLSHQAGLCCFDANIRFTVMDLNDTTKMSRLLEDMHPAWEPGTVAGYHPLTMGLLMDQLMRRIDDQKRGLGEFFDQEIAKPFGIDFYIGLPFSEFYRMARVKNNALKVFWQSMQDPFLRSGFLQLLLGNKESLFSRATSNSNYINEIHKFNQPDYMRMPLASGVGTAESLAKLHSLLIDGSERLLRKSTVDLLTNPVYVGPDVVLMQPNTSFGWGFQYFLREDHWNFGHCGYGGMMTLADLANQLSIAYVTSDYSGYLADNEPRYAALRDAVYHVVDGSRNVASR